MSWSLSHMNSTHETTFYRIRLLQIYGWTCSVASPVTSGMGFCCESLAFTCTIERFDAPGAMAFTTMPMTVPVPLTPAVFGWRVAEIIAWPWSLLLRLAEPHPEHTIAISCVPPDKNPPC